MLRLAAQRLVFDDAARFGSADALAGNRLNSFGFAVLARALHFLRVARCRE